MRDRKRRSKTESGICRSDFDDFRAAFFHQAFPIATSYIDWGDFRSEDSDRKILHDKIPRHVHGPLTKTERKQQRYDNTHTRAIRFRPQRYTRTFEGMAVDSGVDNTAFDMHSSVAVPTTDGCCTILLPPTRRAAG